MSETATTSPPSLLSVTRTSGTAVLVVWENVIAAGAGYTRIYLWMRELPTGNWAQVNAWNYPTKRATHIHGIAANKSYEFRLQALGPAGTSGWSSSRSVGEWQETPLSPHEVAATVREDGRVLVEWTNRNTAAAPYRWLYIFRSLDGGKYVQINRLTMPLAPGHPLQSSYVDSPGPDRTVSYRLWASNEAGADYYHGPPSNTVTTLPSAPSRVTMAWLPAGIQVAWQRNDKYVGRYEVEHQVEGGEWTAQGTVTNASQWLMTNPGASAARRRARVRAASAGGATSAWATSGWLPGATAPLLPVALPSHSQDATRMTAFAWEYRPVDGAAQTAWRIRQRVAGTSTWVTHEGSGSAPYAEIALGRSNGQDIEWQVSTQGAQTAPFSGWSAAQIQRLRAAPQVNITTPATGVDYPSADLRVNWTIAGEQSWSVTVVDDTGALLAVREGSGAHTGQVVFPGLLSDGRQVTVRVDAVTSVGRADTGTVVFNVVLERPAAPVIDITVDHESALVLLSASAGAGSAVATEAIEWLRSVDDGETWEVIGAQDSVPGSLTDWTPPTRNPRLRYAARATSGVPSSEMSAPRSALVESRATWLNWGDNYQNAATGSGSTLTGVAGREVAAHRFLGRDTLAFFRGARRNRDHKVSVLLPESVAADAAARWAEGAEHDGPAVFRDSSGRRLEGQVSDFNWSEATPMPGFQTVTFTFTER